MIAIDASWGMPDMPWLMAKQRALHPACPIRVPVNMGPAEVLKIVETRHWDVVDDDTSHVVRKASYVHPVDPSGILFLPCCNSVRYRFCCGATPHGLSHCFR